MRTQTINAGFLTGLNEFNQHPFSRSCSEVFQELINIKGFVDMLNK